jgi:hypothetical protein
MFPHIAEELQFVVGADAAEPTALIATDRIDGDAPPPPPGVATTFTFAVTDENCLRVTAGGMALRFNGAGKPITAAPLPAAGDAAALAAFAFEPQLLSNGAFSLGVPGAGLLIECQLDQDRQLVVPVAEAQASNFSELRIETVEPVEL